MYLNITIIISTVILALVVLSIAFKSEHPVLHILYLFAALIVIIMGFNITNNIIIADGLDVNIAPLFFILIIIFILVFAFYLVTFIKETIEKIREKNAEEGFEG